MSDLYGAGVSSAPDSHSHPAPASPGRSTPRRAAATEEQDMVADRAASAFGGVGPPWPEHRTGATVNVAADSTAPSNHVGPVQQTESRHVSNLRVKVLAESQPCTEQGRTVKLPSVRMEDFTPRVQMQDFTSAVAAAAAAGAMTALQKLPAAQLQCTSGEQHAAFMATARVAASAAAMHATSILSQPFNSFDVSQGRKQPPCVLGKYPDHSAMLARHSGWGQPQLPTTCATVDGRVRQILDHPVAGNAARTRSDGSAHLPGSPPRASGQMLQQSLMPEEQPQHKPEATPGDSLPDDAESLDMSERCETRVSRSEQSLIKRLQLYAWVVSPSLSNVPASRLPESIGSRLRTPADMVFA